MRSNSESSQLNKNGIDTTHDVEARSWLESANVPGCDFPVQNLPHGVFRERTSARAFRGGIAIGDGVLDVGAILDLFEPSVRDAAQAAAEPALNRLMSLGRRAARALRARTFELLTEGQYAGAVRPHVLPLDDVELGLPAVVGDFTDFYASVFHATNAGSMFRPQNPLLPNYKYVPVAYHGRSSSIAVAADVRRPSGQLKSSDAERPGFGPSRRLDYEAEIGFYVGTPSSGPVAIDAAEDYIFGFCVVNDWSARDIQAWEYQPLGPFLGKNFATTVSPWIVTTEALAPFRTAAFERPEGDPAPLPHLTPSLKTDAAFDIEIEVSLSTARMRERREEIVLSRGSYASAYWTPAQMLAHHASNGCPMRSGDLVGSGTLSGETRDAWGSLLELSWNGTQSMSLPDGERRTFLEDGDEVAMRARCARNGFASIGFGEARAKIVS
jgi:fumarylacetoacetase